ncbi:hypothetical protein BDW62DRAFT_180884 [Aspergillus aurantiobrunneus]
MYSFSTTGTVVHLTAEAPRPGRGILVAINTTMALGISTAVPFTIVLLLGVQDFHGRAGRLDAQSPGVFAGDGE